MAGTDSFEKKPAAAIINIKWWFNTINKHQTCHSIQLNDSRANEALLCKDRIYEAFNAIVT